MSQPAPRNNENLADYFDNALKRDEKGFASPAERAFIRKRLAEEPLPDGVYAPITSAVPAESPPEAYVMHVYTYKCLYCQSEHKHSDIFALRHLRSRQGHTLIRNQSKVTKLEWNVPIQVHNLATRESPGCFECLDALRDLVLPTLVTPPPPARLVQNHLAAQGLDSRDTTKPKATKTPKFTADDL